jgi:hypothetical protein
MKKLFPRLVAFLLFILLWSPWVQAETLASPEVDLYLTHNSIFRSRVIAGMNYSDVDSRWSSGVFEYSVDFGLKSFFRRYVYKDPNVEKNKIVSVRLGYAYLPNFNPDDVNNDENRFLSELTLRLPMGGRWLWTDRNRGELRWIEGSESGRYRNRLRLERAFVFLGFRGTPYAGLEGFYDTRVDRWNRAEMRLGVEFPWHYSVIFEPYFIHQANWEGDPREFIGFVVQKHMAMPIGDTQ